MEEEKTTQPTMTPEEAKLSTRKKVSAIETLCKQLSITLSAEEVVTEQGIIKKMVYYTDNEKYNIVDEKATKPNEKETTEPTPEAEAPADKPEAPAEEAKNEGA